jgi:hypothetical protein
MANLLPNKRGPDLSFKLFDYQRNQQDYPAFLSSWLRRPLHTVGK